MDFVDWLVTHLTNITNLLNSFTFLDVPLWTLLLSILLVSMVISIFWRGARG